MVAGESLDWIADHGVELDDEHLFQLRPELVADLRAGRPALLGRYELHREIYDEDERRLEEGDLCVGFDDGLEEEMRAAPPPLRKYEQAEIEDVDPTLERVDELLRSAWFLRFRADPPRLERVNDHTVADEIELLWATGRQGRPSFDFLRERLSIDPTPEGVASVTATGSYVGAWYICSCGSPGDRCEYVWIREQRLLVTMRSQCGGWIDYLHILPPPFDDAKRAERETRLEEHRMHVLTAGRRYPHVLL